MKEINLNWFDIKKAIDYYVTQEIDKEIEKRVKDFEQELFKRRDTILINIVAEIQNNLYRDEQEVIIKIPIRKF